MRQTYLFLRFTMNCLTLGVFNFACSGIALPPRHGKRPNTHHNYGCPTRHRCFTGQFNRELSFAPQAATYYVSTVGNDDSSGDAAHPWTTIQHAVDSVGPGDTILVLAACTPGRASKPPVQRMPGSP